MLRSERLAKEEQFIRRNEFASITDLCGSFNVSKATMRRDISILCQMHPDIILTRGGAMCLPNTVTQEATYTQKLVQHKDEKRRIAEAASGLIAPGSTIILDSGTTNREIVPFLLQMENVHIVTNDIIIASDLACSNGLDITVTGGSLRKGFFTLCGYQAETFITELCVDIAFLNVDAVDISRGCMITNMGEVNFKRNIIKAAKKVVVLCDHSKFTTVSFVAICDFVPISTIITDSGLSPDISEKLKQLNVEVKIV